MIPIPEVIEIPPIPKSKRTLYQIGTDMDALDDILLQLGGDLTDEEVDLAVQQWLTENENNLDKKLQAYCRLVKEKLARAEAKSQEAQDLQSAAAIDNNGAERMKTRLREFMESRGITKMQSGPFTISVVGNGGVQAMKLKADVNDLPPVYQRVEPNNEALRTALNEGVPGIEKYAELEPRGKHVRIK